MTADFLPDYRAVPTSQGWRPSIKRFVGEPEKLVPYKGGPRYFATKDEAIEAAKEYMRGQLNQRIEGSACINHGAELSEIEKWRRHKAEQAQAERLKAFGVRDYRGNPVKVETKQQSRRARV